MSTFGPAVDGTDVTFHGRLDAVGSADCALVRFEWGPAGSGFPNSTLRQTFHTAPQQFVGYESGVLPGTYEVRAVARTDCGVDTGAVYTFTV